MKWSEKLIEVSDYDAPVLWLLEAIEEIEEADDMGSVDRALGRLQNKLNSLGPILDENGGI